MSLLCETVRLSIRPVQYSDLFGSQGEADALRVIRFGSFFNEDLCQHPVPTPSVSAREFSQCTRAPNTRVLVGDR